jgi:hypothetical protein
MLDKTLVDIISMTIGTVGLIGAITKYDFPKARRSVYGENLFRFKEDVINNQVTLFFTFYAAIGLLFQIISNDILGDEIPDRLYSKGFYLLALAISLILIASLIPLIKRLSRWSAKSRWQPEIIKKAKDNFTLAKRLVEENQDPAENKRATEITDWLEELLEMKSHKQDLKSRLEFFEPYFK